MYTHTDVRARACEYTILSNQHKDARKNERRQYFKININIYIYTHVCIYMHISPRIHVRTFVQEALQQQKQEYK